MMKGETIVFYLLAALTLVSAAMAVGTRRIFRSAVYLLSSLIGIAGLYFWMRFEFAAAVQIVVYAGGIAVLIIFSVFLTQRAGDDMPTPPILRTIAAAGAALLGMGLVMLQLVAPPFPTPAVAEVDRSVSAIGRRMLATGDDGFALPFEVVSLLLLAAMIGCIVIAMRAKPNQP
jgi:NADH-quinone oxidoreductase subunit J